MSIFDNLYFEEEETSPENLESSPVMDSVADKLFADVDEPTEEKEPVEEISTEIETPETEEKPEVKTEETVDAPVEPEAKPKALSYEDLDAFFAKRKEYDEQQKLLKEYQERDAKEKALIAEQEKAKENTMPDPLYQPEEYRQWVFEQNKRIEQSYEARLAQFQNQMLVDNITANLDKTIAPVKEKYGETIFKEAEEWAADIVQRDPKGSIEYLKNNPSWEGIVAEYVKQKEQQEYLKDPDAFIARKIEERQKAAQVDDNSVMEESKPRKTPSKSINSVSSSTDPKASVPEFMKNLY